jgi:PilZ domain
LKRRIVVISNSGPEGWWSGTILARPDFDVLYAQDFMKAYQGMLNAPAELFIFEEWPGESHLLTFLFKVRSTLKTQELKGIVISTSDNPSISDTPVAKVLVPPLTPEMLNKAVAEVLGLATRANKRYLTRVHLAMAPKVEDARVIATVATLNITASGMLIEAVKPLPVGKDYVWSFIGVAGLKDLMIQGKIIREEPMTSALTSKRYVVQFDPMAEDKQKVLGDFIEQIY